MDCKITESSSYSISAIDIMPDDKEISKALNVSIDVLLNNTSNIVDLNKIDENQREAIELILNLPKAKVDKVVGFCQALMENEN